MATKNINDLFERIDWDESISGAVLNGLTDINDYDVPDDLKDIWEEMAENILLACELMDRHYKGYDANKEY
jgi:hypothetical protein